MDNQENLKGLIYECVVDLVNMFLSIKVLMTPQETKLI